MFPEVKPELLFAYIVINDQKKFNSDMSLTKMSKKLIIR